MAHVKRLPLDRLLLALAIATLMAPGAAAGQTTTWHAGGAVYSGELPSPFGAACPGSSAPGLPRAEVGGPEIHGSMVRSSGVDLSLRLSLMFDQRQAVVCPDGFPPEDGTHVARRYERDVAGGVARSVELSAGFSPPFVPVVRAAVGAGWLAGGARPYGVASLGLRVGGRVRFMADWGVRYAAVPRTVTVVEWQDGEVVDHERFTGTAWATGRELRLGIDLRVR